jgi:nucleotide-binding universal stress UspA family protein
MTTLPAPREEPRRTPPHDPAARGRERRVAPYIVLVGLDLSEPGGRAWRFAFDLAALRGENSEVHAVVVGTRKMAPAQRDIPTPGASTSRTSEEGRRYPSLKVLQHWAPGGQARLMAMHYRTGRPDRAIVDLAREIGADLIVVATHPTTRLQRLLGGSVADRIARNAPCPVVVVRPKTDGEEEPGLLEYDPSC